MEFLFGVLEADVADGQWASLLLERGLGTGSIILFGICVSGPLLTLSTIAFKC